VLRTLTTLVTTTLLAASGFAFTPAHASERWLYVMSADDIRVVPGESDLGRIVLLSDIQALQFTDRPQRSTEQTSPRSIMRDFGWSKADGRLHGKTPNAAVSIAGSGITVVEVQRARISKDRMTLFVRGLDGPLETTRGAGSVFIDDASGEQTAALAPTAIATANYNPQGPSISISVEVEGITVWSGTLTPSAASVSVPTSSSGGSSVTGSFAATFSPSETRATFSGSITDNGQTSAVTGLVVGDWSSS